MKNYHRLLLAELLSTAGRVAAQAPATVPLHLVQTIELAPNAALGGTIRLPNHNTVLFITDTDRAAMRAQCLAPNGHTLWETTVRRYQRPRQEGLLGNTLTSTEQMDAGQVRQAASLLPLSVLTEGNNVLVVERIDASAVKKLPKDSPLAAGQVYVQRLSEQGQLTSATFAPPPPITMEAEETAQTVGRYADAGGFVEIVRETAFIGKKERVQRFFLLHYDLGTTTPRREPLILPPSPWIASNWDMFGQWNQDWAYLGHRTRRISAAAPSSIRPRKKLASSLLCSGYTWSMTGAPWLPAASAPRWGWLRAPFPSTAAKFQTTASWTSPRGATSAPPT